MAVRYGLRDKIFFGVAGLFFVGSLFFSLSSFTGYVVSGQESGTYNLFGLGLFVAGFIIAYGVLHSKRENLLIHQYR